MEGAVLEVILDSGAPDPADSAVDDDHLPVVDVGQPAQVPAVPGRRAQGASGSTRLRGPRDVDLDPGSGESLVELARAAFGIGALPVDDQPHRHALPRLLDQRCRKPVADQARTETELIDVDRRGRAGDIGEHRRVEVAALDVELRRGGAGRLERECEGGPRDTGCSQESLGVRSDAAVRDDDSSHV